MPSDELVIETVSFKQQSQAIYQILAVLDFKFQAFQASQPGATLGNKPINRCKSANFPFLFFCSKKTRDLNSVMARDILWRTRSATDISLISHGFCGGVTPKLPNQSTSQPVVDENNIE